MKIPPLAWLTQARRAARLTRHMAGDRDGPARACHSWYPERGDDVVHGGRGVDGLNLPSLDAASLIGTLRLAPGVQPRPSMLIAADGVVTFTDDRGRAQAVSGTISINGHTLRFFGIRRIGFRPEA